ncbi:hypothetical protein TCAL_10300 [Tigriopus californicus]|uniref:Thymidine phosphorylase n=1 Tax=Tigriopus californicus TaxID=6832 RepID=A0A553NZ65_TIGCA|nr:thymidine phosphorylase-like [Tigriopus californicus]TRY70721.1 hypothetical protein TCAL_10300 [Tigriopus californicus]
MADINVRIPDLIEKKKDGKEFTDDEIKFFIDKLLSGGVADSQLGAWLMATCIRGLNTQETYALTKAMTDTGSMLQWPEEWKSILVDKHSTGGVGDKVSLVLAPALAAVGLKVPMISGRGLGITGGTLDKLESIPGYRVSLSVKEIHNILDQVGCCIAGQTGTIAPADKKMYACRDITGTVQNLSLVTSSIVCKKAAENLRALVLDVKFGNGSFCTTEDEAAKLAASLISVSRKFGMKTSAVISSMNCPLGCTVGNSLEVEESIECLKGKGPADLRELVIVEGSLLMASVKDISLEEGEIAIKTVLDDGSALSKFRDMIMLQGVSRETAEDLCHGSIWKALKSPQTTTDIKAKKSGVVRNINARKVATVSQFLGAGRAQPSDQIDHSVGVKLKLLNGQKVGFGESWATVYHQGEALPEHLLEIMAEAIEIDEVACSTNGASPSPSKIVRTVTDTDATNNLVQSLS